ncbi:MAG: MFS transporter, partial [Caldilineaceae bacterium]|nr:MFS transporter [Caldilineaceae bacterium]
GLIAPLIGSLADQQGYRRVMRLMLVAIIVGLLLVAGSPTIAVALGGFMIMGIGLSGFVPTLHAYLSSRLPYHKRARGLGMLEYSWALAGIVGLYTMGQLIALTNWRVPLFVLAAGLSVMWFVLGALPAARRKPTQHGIKAAGSPTAASTLPAWPTRFGRFFRLGERARSAYSAIAAGTLLFFAGMQLFVAHGAWLNFEYNLGAAALGTVALVLGCFDLSASVSVSLFTDRIGKLRSVLLGVSGVFLGYLFMPFLNGSLLGAMVGIIITRTAFEFGIVSHISLISEQIPEQRGKLMSMSAAFVLLGGTAATWLGPWLYATHGVQALSWTGMAAAATAFVLLMTRVDEGA